MQSCKSQTCMIFRVRVMLVPRRINKSDQKPAMYPVKAIILHGTALNQAACLRFTWYTCNTLYHLWRLEITTIHLQFVDADALQNWSRWASMKEAQKTPANNHLKSVTWNVTCKRKIKTVPQTSKNKYIPSYAWHFQLWQPKSASWRVGV